VPLETPSTVKLYGENRLPTEAERRGRTRHGISEAERQHEAQAQKARRTALAGKASRQGQQRTDRVVRYSETAPAGTPWTAPYRKPTVPKLRQVVRFRLFARLANGKTVRLSRIVNLTWDDATAILTGSLTTGVPTFAVHDPEVRLQQGDRVACYASIAGGSFRHIWTMRVYKPEYHAADRQRTYQLANDLELLRLSEDNFVFKKDKKHPHGWTGPQIIREVCKRYGVPVGAIYGSKKSLTKGSPVRVKLGSPLEVIRSVIWRERKRNGRKLFIRWTKGKLYVMPLRRSRNLIALGTTLIDAMLSQEMPEQFSSALTIHALPEFKAAEDASGAKKSKLGKMHLYLESPVSRRLYGFVHRVVWSPDAKTTTLLRKEGLAYLRASARPKKTLTLTHPGMPFLRRGDAIRVAIGGRALRRQVVWASHIVHQASAEGYTVEIEVTFDDPYIDRRGQTILQKLKATKDDAVGNRARLDPLWYLPKNNKGDSLVPGATPAFPEVQRGYKSRLRGERAAGVGSFDSGTGAGGPFQ
jgi:hypothetical protein